MVTVCVLVGLILGLNHWVLDPIVKDISDAKRGVHHYQKEVARLNREIASMTNKIIKKTANDDAYHHFFTLFSDPLKYINQFILTQAKPPGVVMVSSSVAPNANFSSLEKKYLEPHIKSHGISRIQNIHRHLTVFRLHLVAVGSYSDMLQFIDNLYQLPIVFSLQMAQIEEANQGLRFTLKIGVVVHPLSTL
tara:strand:+ start:156 stop:731 length:576 start_codon:yes stop_codon:yes gene_type:complete